MESKTELRKFFIQSKRIGFSIWENSTDSNKDDLKLAKELWGNKEVTKFISAKGYFTEEEIIQRFNKEIENYKNYNIQYFPIFLLESKEFIGCCGLRPYDKVNNILEIGIHLLPQFWNKGYGTESMQRMIDYAFKDLKVNNIFAGHNPNNLRSEKLLKKIGFNFIRNEYYEPTGLMHPSYLYKVS